MLRKLARGLGMAARSSAAPLVIGARVASWRQVALGEDLPVRGGGIAAASKMALDEIFLATELAAAPLVSLRERTRMARELSARSGSTNEAAGSKIRPATTRTRRRSRSSRCTKDTAPAFPYGS